jgi:hypothetical protein
MKNFTSEAATLAERLTEIRRVKIHKKTGSRSIPCRNTCTTHRQRERL